MPPAIQRVVILLVVLLIVVIGLIVLTTGSAKDDAAITTENQTIAQEVNETGESQQTDVTPAPDREETADGAQAGQVSESNVAQEDEDAQGNEMYEGALAGLSEEEIAKMALEEETSAARTDPSGAEDAVD